PSPPASFPRPVWQAERTVSSTPDRSISVTSLAVRMPSSPGVGLFAFASTRPESSAGSQPVTPSWPNIPRGSFTSPSRADFIPARGEEAVRGGVGVAVFGQRLAGGPGGRFRTRQRGGIALDQVAKTVGH